MSYLILNTLRLMGKELMRNQKEICGKFSCACGVKIVNCDISLERGELDVKGADGKLIKTRIRADLVHMTMLTKYNMGAERETANEHLHICSHCGMKETKKSTFKVCRRCKGQKLRVQHYYCSDKCHKDHWPIHGVFHRLMKLGTGNKKKDTNFEEQYYADVMNSLSHMSK